MNTQKNLPVKNENTLSLDKLDLTLKQASLSETLTKGLIWLVFLIALIIGILMIFKYLGSRPEPEVILPPPITVSTSELTQGAITPRYSFIGEISAKQTASISVEINNARILSLPADSGDEVKVGDTLAVLDNQTLQYQRDQAFNAYEQAKDEYQRKNRLGLTGGVSQEQLVATRTAMNAAKARLDDAELTLSKSTLTSPVAGIIISRHQDIGSLANPSSPLFTIAVNGITEFVAKVPENQLSLFSLGQAVTITLSGHPEPMTGKIRLIEPKISATERTANLYIAFEDEIFKPIGLFGMADIELANQSGFIIPTTAILLDDQGHYIWTVNQENRINKVYINELARQDNRAIIEIKNKKQNDNTPIIVVLRAGTLVNEGDEVTPSHTESAKNVSKTQ